MKCRLRIRQQAPNPDFWIELPGGKGHVPKASVSPDINPWVWQEKGTEIEHPDAWRLVLIGKADPADDACKAKTAGVWDDDFEMMMRQMEYEALEAGRPFKRTGQGPAEPETEQDDDEPGDTE